MTRRQLGGVLSLASVGAVASPRTVGAQSASPRMESYLSNVVLTTHENRTVRFYDDLVRGKVVTINFMFTDCKRFCPATIPNLVRVQEALGERVGRDIFLYSITLDPATDTPAVLKAYAKEVGAGPGWIFLTGKEESIERLRRRLGVYDRDPAIDADKTQHSGLVVYGNDALDRWAAISGLNKPEFIVRAVLRVAGSKEG
jgi:protein SCO1/2